MLLQLSSAERKSFANSGLVRAAADSGTGSSARVSKGVNHYENLPRSAVFVLSSVRSGRRVLSIENRRTGIQSRSAGWPSYFCSIERFLDSQNGGAEKAEGSWQAFRCRTGFRTRKQLLTSSPARRDEHRRRLLFAMGKASSSFRRLPAGASSATRRLRKAWRKPCRWRY
jgi:hypothetical protein